MGWVYILAREEGRRVSMYLQLDPEQSSSGCIIADFHTETSTVMTVILEKDVNPEFLNNRRTMLKELRQNIVEPTACSFTYI